MIYMYRQEVPVPFRAETLGLIKTFCSPLLTCSFTGISTDPTVKYIPPCRRISDRAKRQISHGNSNTGRKPRQYQSHAESQWRNGCAPAIFSHVRFRAGTFGLIKTFCSPLLTCGLFAFSTDPAAMHIHPFSSPATEFPTVQKDFVSGEQSRVISEVVHSETGPSSATVSAPAPMLTRSV